MIIEMSVNDNLFSCPATCIVNAVNCDGVMGAGLALAFRRKYPLEYYQSYQGACWDKTLVPGVVRLWQGEHTVIADFPTVGRLGQKCLIEWVEQGLSDLREKAEKMGVLSIGIPAIGCGIVGHDWGIVKSMIIKSFKDSAINIYLYPPK